MMAPLRRSTTIPYAPGVDPALTGSLTAALGALLGAGATHIAARHRERETRLLTIEREARIREDDAIRERTRELRIVVDDAVVALGELRRELDATLAYVETGSSGPLGRKRFDLRPLRIAVDQVDAVATRLAIQVDYEDALLVAFADARRRPRYVLEHLATEEDIANMEEGPRSGVVGAVHDAKEAQRAFQRLARRRFFRSDPMPGAMTSIYTIVSDSGGRTNSSEQWRRVRDAVDHMDPGYGQLSDGWEPPLIVRTYVYAGVDPVQQVKDYLDAKVPEWESDGQISVGLVHDRRKGS